jgi:hypothetical protein
MLSYEGDNVNRLRLLECWVVWIDSPVCLESPRRASLSSDKM